MCTARVREPFAWIAFVRRELVLRAVAFAPALRAVVLRALVLRAGLREAAVLRAAVARVVLLRVLVLRVLLRALVLRAALARVLVAFVAVVLAGGINAPLSSSGPRARASVRVVFGYPRSVNRTHVCNPLREDRYRKSSTNPRNPDFSRGSGTRLCNIRNARSSQFGGSMGGKSTARPPLPTRSAPHMRFRRPRRARWGRLQSHLRSGRSGGCWGCSPDWLRSVTRERQPLRAPARPRPDPRSPQAPSPRCRSAPAGPRAVC